MLSGGSRGRSREEFSAGGYLLYGLAMPVGRDDVLRVIEHVDSCGLVDVGIPMGTTNYTLLFDWDGSAYHGPDRLDADVRKTRRMLALDRGDGVRPIVVRVREPASPAFPTALEDQTLAGALVVVVTSKHPGKILQQVAAQLAPLLPEPFGSTLLGRASGEALALRRWTRPSTPRGRMSTPCTASSCASCRSSWAPARAVNPSM